MILALTIKILEGLNRKVAVMDNLINAKEKIYFNVICVILSVNGKPFLIDIC